MSYDYVTGLRAARARRLRTVIDHPPDWALNSWRTTGALLAWLRTYYAASCAEFGDAALVAATARPRPGTCRWCVIPAPRVYTDALGQLLGRPCPTCSPRVMASLVARVDANRSIYRRTRERPSGEASTASAARWTPPARVSRTASAATVAEFHPGGCAECATYLRLKIPRANRVPHARRPT